MSASKLMEHPIHVRLKPAREEKGDVRQNAIFLAQHEIVLLLLNSQWV